MKPEIENLKEYVSHVSLSSEEKLDMFNNLRTYMDNNPIKTRYNFFARQTLAYASIFALLVGTTATSFAAENSLPGDILYPIKTNINETLVRSLSISDTQKAKTSVNLVSKRTKELERMIKKKTDTPEKVNIIVTKLEEHTQGLQEFIEEADSDLTNSEDTVKITKKKEVAEIYSTLELIMEEHLQVIESLKQKEKDQVQTTTQDDTKDDTPQEPTTDSTTMSNSTPNEKVPSSDMKFLNTTEDKKTISSSTSQTSTSTQEKSETTKKIADFSARLEILIESAINLVEKKSDQIQDQKPQ